MAAPQETALKLHQLRARATESALRTLIRNAAYSTSSATSHRAEYLLKLEAALPAAEAYFERLLLPNYVGLRQSGCSNLTFTWNTEELFLSWQSPKTYNKLPLFAEFPYIEWRHIEFDQEQDTKTCWAAYHGPATLVTVTNASSSSNVLLMVAGPLENRTAFLTQLAIARNLPSTRRPIVALRKAMGCAYNTGTLTVLIMTSPLRLDDVLQLAYDFTLLTFSVKGTVLD